MGKPSIYPTGVTIYDKERTFNGYTVYNAACGIVVIDMNGRIVKMWKDLEMPFQPLPEGNLIASKGNIPGPPGAASKIHVLQTEWDGKVVWHYSSNIEYTGKDGEKYMGAAHHHDLERRSFASGYFTPGCEPILHGGRNLILTHNRLFDRRISDKSLLDERIIELDENNNIVWEWNSHEHFEEFGLKEDARKALYANPMIQGDWIHINAISELGSNRHFDAGDIRFDPQNIICSSRQLNIIFIIDKSTGKIVWRIGPDYNETLQGRKIQQIIGQHHAHMIPKGLPGEGNILVFDNGCYGGYGAAHETAPDGTNAVRRHFSRVVEFDPVTFEKVWEYTQPHKNQGRIMEVAANAFSSPYISSAQRLVNGNTLINEGADGIFMEITPDKEIVWEFINPISNPNLPKQIELSVYRAYRVPYEWMPQLEKPEEISIEPPDIRTFRVPGSFPIGDKEAVAVNVEIK